ncbi:hypothetical protein R6Q57_022197 [Mikania cordata]
MHYCSPSLDVDYEFEKLVNRMHPPRVTVDHIADKNSTLIKVDSANKRGSLLEVVQSLGRRGCSFRSLGGSVGVQYASENTTIELTGRDRPGLLCSSN